MKYTPLPSFRNLSFYSNDGTSELSDHIFQMFETSRKFKLRRNAVTHDQIKSVNEELKIRIFIDMLEEYNMV